MLDAQNRRHFLHWKINHENINYIMMDDLMAVFLSFLLIPAFVVLITPSDFIPGRLTFILSINYSDNAENEKKKQIFQKILF
jgi:hypothetical protein